MIAHIGRRDLKRIFYSLSKHEFEITHMLLYLFDVDFDTDHSLIYDYNNIELGCKRLALPEKYEDLETIRTNPDLAIFRPLKNDKHANVLIRMLEDLNFIDFDAIQIEEYTNESGRIKYKGYLIKDGEMVDGSLIKSAPNTALLKISMIANMLMDYETHEIYYKELVKFLHKKTYR